jgi:hypothetical protein
MEGHEPLDDEEVSDLLHDIDIAEERYDQYITEFGSVDGISMVAALNDQITTHYLTKTADLHPRIPFGIKEQSKGNGRKGKARIRRRKAQQPRSQLREKWL